MAHGERLTLTLWFTLLPMHSEDVKVLQLLPQSTDGARRFLHASLYGRAANDTHHGLQRQSRMLQSRALITVAMQPELCSLACAGFASRDRPQSIFQDSGDDIRMLRLAAAGLAVIACPGPDDSQSDPVTITGASQQAAELCSSHGAAGHCSILFDSVQQALLAVAFAQWQAGATRPHSCSGCTLELLAQQRLQLGAYMQRLQLALPTAVAEWHSAALLFDTHAAT